MKKIYTLIVLMLMPLMAFSQTSRTINVATAGTLPDLISDEEKYTIEELTLTGELNGTDFRLLRDMAGNNYSGDPTNGKLRFLDISGVHIAAGGDKYLETNGIKLSSGISIWSNMAFSMESDCFGDYLFGGCEKLVELKMPNSLKKISNSFWGCSSMASFLIPKSVESFSSTFNYCNSITSIAVEEGNAIYDSRDGCNAIIETATNTLISGHPISTIPNTVTAIGASAFSHYKDLTSIVIPNSVKVIGNSAFSVTSLTSLTIPNSVTTIGRQAFWGCDDIKELVIPSSVTSIGSQAFSVCSGLKSIAVEEDNPIYDSRKRCNAIIETATNKLVCGCMNTKIPNDINVIGDYAFQSSSGLTSITIPQSVTSIGIRAFRDVSLSTIEIPSSVTSIGKGAFEDCESLKSFIVYIATPLSVESTTFLFNKKNTILYVPSGSEALYGAADFWKEFKEIKAIDEQYNTDLETPLTLEAIEGTVQISFYNRYGGTPFSFKYSIDNGPWTDFDASFDGTSSLPVRGKIVRLKSENKGWFSEVHNGKMNKYITIICDADCYIYGNIMSLNKGDDFATNTDLDSKQNFGGIFSNNTHLRNHPEKALLLPSMTLNDYCYREMFKGCTGLTRAPELPATTLTQNCYEGMFSGCTGLTKASSLPAEVMEKSCYDSMFSGCTSLKEAPALPATTLAIGCYSNMFLGCTNLTKAPELPAESIEHGSYAGMFSGCTSLPKAPELPATSLSDECYSRMFNGCTSLTVAPDLPATRTSSYCYSGMFSGCTSLTTTPELPATNIKRECYSHMFENCTNLKSAVLPAPSLVYDCYLRMFKGCTNLSEVTCKATIISNTDAGSGVVSGVTKEWLDGVAAMGTFRKPLSMTTWPRGVDGIPEGWTVEDLESISVGSSGYSTYNNEGLNLNFSETEEMKAYVATGYDYDNQTIWLTRVKDVPAGMPIMVKGSINTGYDIPVEEVSVSYFVNMFKANDTGAPIEISPTDGDMTNYYLSNGIFKSSTGSNTINPGKCYLQIPTVAPVPTVGSSRSVTLNANGFASFCGSVDYDFTDVEGLKAYAATGYDDATGTIWLTRVKRVSAGTGLLLMGAAGGSYTIPSTGVSSYYVNMMVGNTGTSDITIYTTSGDMTNYYLSGNKLLKAAAAGTAGNPIKPGKAYMQIPTKHVTRGGQGGVMPEELVYQVIDEPEVIPMQALTRALGGEDDGTTDIRETVQPRLDDNVFYNLQGQRVDKPTKGLYIRNGKVIVVK